MKMPYRIMNFNNFFIFCTLKRKHFYNSNFNRSWE